MIEDGVDGEAQKKCKVCGCVEQTCAITSEVKRISGVGTSDVIRDMQIGIHNLEVEFPNILLQFTLWTHSECAKEIPGHYKSFIY